MINSNKFKTHSFCSSKANQILLFFAIIISVINTAYSQVGVYTFAQSLVAYAPLSGTETVAYAAPWDDHTAGAAVQVTMPFSFVYDNNTYTQFYISPNGFITFGATQPSVTNYGPINNATAHAGVISALGIDLVSNGSPITYEVIGIAPNRVVVVQWKDAVRKIDVGNFNFQIRLNEDSNIIELSYGLCQPSGATNRLVQVGLRGQNNIFAQGNVNNRSQGSSTVWLNNTFTGTLNSSTVITSNPNAYPDLGLNYKYTPAPPCVTPSNQPTGLNLGATSITDTSINGNSFTAATSLPTNYLVLRSTVNTPPTSLQVVNRVYYPIGTVISSTYTVVNNTNATTFNQTGLLADTTYYYWIISFNDKCTPAPFYNLVNVLTDSATTCSLSTVATAATSVNGNGFTANWTNVPSALNYIIDVSTNNTFTALVPGYSNLSVGNTTSFVVTGLSSLTTYYYRVKAIGIGCANTSNTITVSTICGYYNIPYVQNFDTTPLGAVPTCFTRVDANLDGVQWGTQNINVASAPNAMRINKNPLLNMDDWFFMPGLNLTAGVSYRLFFRYNSGNTSTSVENLKVRLGNAASIAGMNETLLDITNFNNTIYQIAIVDFVPVTNGVYYLGFQGYSVLNQSSMVIDDVSVTLSPNCFEPTNVTVGAVGANTASVAWTASSPAPSNGYEYFLSTSATPPTGATVPTGTVGAGITNLNLIGLTASTYYYIWIRGKCNAADRSVWTTDESFSTDCSTPLITSTTPATRCGYGTVTLNAVPNAGSVANWYNTASGGTIIATGNNYIIPTLSSTTTFYVEAKSSGAIEKVGPVNPTQEGGIIATQNFQASVLINISSNTSLQSIDIYPIVSGQTGQIVVRNSSNVTLATIPFTTSVSGGTVAQVIPINYAFTAGNYSLYLASFPTSGIRMNSTNAFYPYASSVANIMGNTTDNSAWLGFYNWKFTTECLSSRIPVTATVTSPPALTLSSSTSTVCEGYSTPTITVGGHLSYNTLTWSPITGVSGSFAAGFVFNPTVTTVYTLVANQTSGALCGNSITHTVIVNPAPPTIMVVPSTATICENTIQPLNGSASASAAVPIFTDNFNAATNGWTVANTSVGGNTLASQWTLRPDNYNYISAFWNVTFHSNDNSQFYLANSDSQSPTPGIITRTTLTSPSFSLAGYTSASLSFWKYIRFIGTDIDLVEISTNGGTVWTTIKQYTTSQGTATAFTSETLNLNPFLGNLNVKIRFNFTSQWGYVWAIDNLTVSGTLAAALTWTPVTGLYTDATATIPYVLGTPLSVVYAKPIVTTTYTATITGSNSCFRTSTSTITVTPSSVAGTITADQNLCSSTAITNITLTGNVGNIVRWEYADDAAFTINVTPIVNITSTLTPAQMGVFSTIRYFRAVVKNGICNQVYSNVVFVNFPSTTWNGVAWNNGFPDTTKQVIFAGNYTSTGDLTACSVRVNSGVITINSGNTLKVENIVNVVGGSLVFENNSSLLQVNNVVNTGNIIYKRNTTPMSAYDYTYWSSPVAGLTLGAMSPLTTPNRFYTYNTYTDGWYEMSPSTVMGAGVGYIARAPDGFPLTPATSIQETLFVGIPHNGNIVTPVLGLPTPMYNLIGNPYPSALDFDVFISDPANSFIDGTIYLWTHNTPISASYGYDANDYAMYNATGGIGTNAPNLGLNNTDPDKNIASGQGFIILANTSANATFKNNMRVAGLNTNFYRDNQPNGVIGLEKHRVWLDISNNQGGYKRTLVGYIQNATNEMDSSFDGYSASSNLMVSMYSLVGTNQLGIQGRALPFNVSDTVPLGYMSQEATNYTIRLSNYDGLFETQDVYLEDKLLNIVHNLKISDYNFVTEAGTFNERFELRYTDATLSANNYTHEDTIVVYKPNENLHINSGKHIMKEVKVFDVRGRLLFKKDNLNVSSISINIGTTNQVLLVQVTDEDGKIYNKKYIN